jgi:two-component system, LuxR family, response regulator FixJ
MTPNPDQIVHVVDDDDAVRQALCALLASVGIQTRAYPSATRFLEAVGPDTTGCIVLDIRMPGMSGLELQQMLNSRNIRLPVIIVTGHGDVSLAVRAMKAGAADFLLKPFNEQELLDRIQQSLEVHAATQREIQARKEAAQRFAGLTTREREVLARVMAGQHNKAIAFDLGISEKTVDVHRFNIMRKTGARTLPELIQLRLLADQTAES